MLGFCNIDFYQNELSIKKIIKKEQLEFVEEAINICDLTSVVQKYQAWQKLMPGITPYYAVKCNNDAMILKMLAKLGANFDCASKNEINQVLQLGISSDRIIFANPCKMVSHLQFAKEHNVTPVTVDNEFEIHKLFKYFPNSDLIIRFRSDAKEATFMLGKKFGCDPNTEAKQLMLLAKELNLNVIGTSFHIGSGSKEFEAYDRGLTLAKNLFDFGKLLGFNMKLVDIGGGFPGTDDESFEKATKIIRNAIKKNFKNDDIRVIAEPGKFLVETAFTLICRIHAKREVHTSDGDLDRIMYYLNDGIYGCFKWLLYEHPVLKVKSYLNNNDDLPKFNTTLFGPTCDPIDKISENLYLPNLKIGDFISFFNMGAYTVPIASSFAGFMLPTTKYFLKAETFD